ncbi:hypothetical protein LEP1GSC050_0052 [Leptospira phage vB_LbrZ_5399-LE1]|uniref:HTH cro/C1-type domain-containing protein n=1 Tax=Leptospira inadai serovar Lyme TaxID=293084 RepID=A0ABX4YGD5_9LEPT|nr:hypothetical protein [Leptospira inadai]AGS80700.1 hypothetical protein LEP1GSC050_0052 [Leptospira phage vB_LbrZ_5399-LE1]AGS80856.1 hypothetical protein LEP1GSC047_0917 [Leptospira phage vB_LinZ_10-LE1]PNV74316.1 hypothetical protein BES34_014110 [Leptospira inadai serovar Lyme]
MKSKNVPLKLLPEKIDLIIEEKNFIKVRRFADFLHVKDMTIHSLKNGGTLRPSHLLLDRLEDRLRVNRNWLLDDNLPVLYKNRYLPEDDETLKKSFEPILKVFHKEKYIPDLQILALTLKPEDREIVFQLVRHLNSIRT